jgi:hypothetical protein
MRSAASSRFSLDGYPPPIRNPTGAAGTNANIVYQPGGTPVTSLVFTSWVQLCEYALTVPTPKTIWFDLSHVSGTTTLPAGNYNFGPNTSFATTNPSLSLVNFAAGTTLTNLPIANHGVLLSVDQGPTVGTVSATEDSYLLVDQGGGITSVSGAFANVPPSGNLIMTLRDTASLTGTGVVTLAAEVGGDTADASVTLYDTSFVSEAFATIGTSAVLGLVAGSPGVGVPVTYFANLVLIPGVMFDTIEPPNGLLVGNVGDLVVNTHGESGEDNTLWAKSTNGVNTGWVSYGIP